MEQLFDAYSSTLAANYTSGSGTASVTSASGLPSIGTFTLLVLNSGSGAAIVALKVTARSGTTLTVVADGTDASASSGSTVIGGIVSTRAVQQVMSDWLGYGTYASLPSTTGRLNGMVYRCSDVDLEFVFNGSAWQARAFGRPVTLPPALSQLTTTGSGTIIFDQSKGVLYLAAFAGTSTYAQNGQLVGANIPGSTYTIIVGCQAAWQQKTFAQFGLWLADNVGSYAGRRFSIVTVTDLLTPQVFVQSYTGFTFGSTLFSEDLPVYPLGTALLWLKIVVDASHRTYYVGDDQGNWYQMYQEAAGTGFTDAQYGVFVDTSSTGQFASMTVYDMTATHP